MKPRLPRMIAVALFLTGLSLPPAALAHDMGKMDMGASLPVAGASQIGGGYSLTDQNGRTVTDRDFAGRYQLIYFGFASCPDVCPVDLRKMTDALNILGGKQAGRVAPIFITVDPERDTPEALKRYVPQFSPKLTGLTGPKDQIAAVLAGYKVYAAKAGKPQTGDYAMSHSAYIYLMGPDGKFIDIFGPDDKASDIAAKLKKLVSL